MKKIIYILLCFTLLMGCGKEVPISTEKSETITLTDQMDREVILPEEITKIVSCYYTATSSLIALGAEDKLVGIEIGAENRELYKQAAPELLELPAVGSGKSFNMEQTLALTPDVVIMPTRLAEYIPTLEEAGIAVVVVSPESNEELLEMFDILGQVSGMEENAEKLHGFYDEKLTQIKELDLQPTQKVYLSSNSSYLSTATSKMYQNYLIETAGGINVSSDLVDSYWANISPEQLQNYNPDVWFVVYGSSYNIEEIYGDERLENINAVENGAVFQIPDALEGWDYPTPSAILGVLWATNILHPEAYTKEMLQEDTTEFYKTFYDLAYVQRNNCYPEE